MRNFLYIFLLVMMASPIFAEEGKVAEYLRQGTAYLDAQDYQSAVDTFKRAVRINPKNAEAHQGLGMTYQKLGSGEASSNPEMLDNAVTSFKNALRIDPNFAQARYQLGLTYLLLFDKKSATTEYEALKPLDSKLAEQLFASIKGYKSPVAFRSRDTRVGAEGNATRVTIVHNSVLVPVTLTLGDRTVEATLILDTGASITVINKDVADRLDIDLAGARKEWYQAVGGMTRGWHTKIDGVTVGPHSQAGVDVAVVQKGGVGAFDGLLGMNFLRSFKYSIDFTNQVINWSPQ